MGGDGHGDPAQKLANLNARLGLPRTMRMPGYRGEDIVRLVEESLASHFNLRSPWLPSRTEYEQLINTLLLEHPG